MAKIIIAKKSSTMKEKIKSMTGQEVVDAHITVTVNGGDEFKKGTQVTILSRHTGDPIYYVCLNGSRKMNVHLDNLTFLPSSKEELEIIKNIITEQLSILNSIIAYGEQSGDYNITDELWKVEMMLVESKREDIEDGEKRLNMAEIMLLKASDLLPFLI